MSADTAIQILFLRGINVGGRNKLPMADLRAILQGLGLSDIKTHIQSGNAVFRSALSGAELSELIMDAVQAQFDFRPIAMVVDEDRLSRVVSENPFQAQGADNGAAVQIGFLSEPARAAQADRMAQIAASDEEFQITEGAFYLHAPSGIGRSKLAANAEKLLGVAMTIRNQRVVEAMKALAGELHA